MKIIISKGLPEQKQYESEVTPAVGDHIEEGGRVYVVTKRLFNFLHGYILLQIKPQSW